MLHIMRIAFNGVMVVNLNIHGLQLLFKAFDGLLALVLGNHYTAHIKALGAVHLHQAQHIQIIGQA